MKKVTIIASVVFIFASGGALGAQAAAKPNTCTLSASDFDAIQAIQSDPTLTPVEELNQELALRKRLLAQTISCATSDAQALQKTLNAVTPADNSAVIQGQLSGKLDDAINFYAIELAKLNSAGVSGSQAIAKEMIAWRAANYAPLEGQVNNFILWTKNQSLFDTAQDRLIQTQQIVAFIESAAPGAGLEVGLSAARASLQAAQSENANAKASLAQFLPPDQSLAEIQQSLQSLADAYQNFSDLNTLIQKFLPTGQ